MILLIEFVDVLESNYDLSLSVISKRRQEVDRIGLSCLQDLVGAGGSDAPKCVQEVVAQLTSRLATWDDR